MSAGHAKRWGALQIIFYVGLLSILLVSLAPLVTFVSASMGSGRTTGAVSDGRGINTVFENLRGFFAGIPGSVVLKSLRFTILQSAASTALALAIGLPGAWLSARFDFRGRRVLLALAAIPFCFPPILVILAFILYYGKEGMLSQIYMLLGGRPHEYHGLLYSFWGIVMVHAFYNFPIAVHQVSAHWMRIPTSHAEAARTLGAGKFRAFFVGVFPQLLPSVAQAAGLIFLYCFFSFTTVLVFGGRAGATLEVQIYQALRYQSDLPLSMVYAGIETLFALAGIYILTRQKDEKDIQITDYGRIRRRDRTRGAGKLAVLAYEVFIGIFFLGPLVAIVVEAFRVPASFSGARVFGLGNFSRLLGGFQAPLIPALLSTIKLSGFAALLATFCGVVASSSIYFLRRSGRGNWLTRAIEMSQWLPLAVSPAIMAYGWLFLSSNHTTAYALVAAQAAIAWPFVSRSLHAALRALNPKAREAARTLGASPLRSFVSVELRTIAPSIAAASAFAFSITAGDANVPLMLGMSEHETLPLLLYRLTAAYRFNEACAAGLVLGLITGVVFFLKEKVIDVA